MYLNQHIFSQKWKEKPFPLSTTEGLETVSPLIFQEDQHMQLCAKVSKYIAHM